MGKEQGERRSAKLDVTRGAFSLRNRYGGAPTEVHTFGVPRHARQLDRIMGVDLPLEEKLHLLSKFEHGMYAPGGADQRFCCLFNVIVAFEWNPAYYELELLRHAFDEAANLLFDATDGFFTFNRVSVGGPELMPCADIQIFASNRLFPRAWVNGMHIEAKYQPIRIGRGYWRKNAGRADPWHKNYGPAVLVHEWLHYALGLKDGYIQPEGQSAFALPRHSPAVNTLMANLDSNELIGSAEWEQIDRSQSFAWLRIPSLRKAQHIPPQESPAPLFDLVGGARVDPDDEPPVWLDLEQAGLASRLSLDHCWIFVLTGERDGAHPLDAPGRLIAQGSYERQPEGYRIIGARRGACLILIGREPDTRDMPGAPKVLYREVAGIEGGALTFAGDDWADATPEGAISELPLVCVATDSADPAGPYQLAIRIEDRRRDRRWDERRIFVLGERGASQADAVEALDGHVLLVARGDERPRQLTIASFSIGGSPGAAYPANPNPVPAGSSDGNAMIFFYDDEVAALVKDNKRLEQDRWSDRLRVITTTNLIGPADNAASQPRSYSFAVMPNQPLPADDGGPRFTPTLVLYYDEGAKRDGCSLKLHHLRDGRWELVNDDFQQDFADRQLVAVQLNARTAPGLFPGDARPTPEFYRLMLVSGA